MLSSRPKASNGSVVFESKVELSKWAGASTGVRRRIREVGGKDLSEPKLRDDRRITSQSSIRSPARKVPNSKRSRTSLLSTVAGTIPDSGDCERVS